MRGGSFGCGYVTFEYTGTPYPCSSQCPGTSISPQSKPSNATGRPETVGEKTKSHLPFNDVRDDPDRNFIEHDGARLFLLRIEGSSHTGGMPTIMNPAQG